MPTGTVTWWDEERNFGFIAPEDGGEDVLCHFSVIETNGCSRDLEAGQKMAFDRYDLPEGLVAGNVRRVLDETGTPVTVPGGEAVQLRALAYRRPNLEAMAARLLPFGEVRRSAHAVRLRAPPHELTLFDDGRAIVKGTGDEALARRLVSGWLSVRIPD